MSCTHRERSGSCCRYTISNSRTSAGQESLCFKNQKILSWEKTYSIHLKEVFFPSMGRTHSMWKFPGEGSNRSCSCQPQPQQCHIRAMSATYTMAYSSARSLTHWVRPGMETASSWILARFVSVVPQREFLHFKSKFRTQGIRKWNGCEILFCHFSTVYQSPFIYLNVCLNWDTLERHNKGNKWVHLLLRFIYCM